MIQAPGLFSNKIKEFWRKKGPTLLTKKAFPTIGIFLREFCKTALQILTSEPKKLSRAF
jgi:hypothetical protein